MPILLYNLEWMSFNIFLALIPVALGFAFFKIKKSGIKLVLFSLWLLFLPNTIYLLTDLIHLSYDLHVLPPSFDLMVVGMYIILVLLGVLTYFLSIALVIGKPYKKMREMYFAQLISIHFLVGVGVILGRVYRFNSWDILSKPRHIVYIAYSILSSPEYLTILLLFTIGATLMSFSFFNLLPRYSFVKSK